MNCTNALFTFIFSFIFLVKVKCEVLCETGFCREYEFETGCAAPAQQCSNGSGLWLPSPTTCNCCKYCLPFYGSGELCSTGGPGTGTTVGRCGAGLTCAKGSDGVARCTRMQTPCQLAQDDYDARHSQGATGALEVRPVCDAKGRYGPYHCMPTQTCFCQSEEGERIFGEAANLGAATMQSMHCGNILISDAKLNRKVVWCSPQLNPHDDPEFYGRASCQREELSVVENGTFVLGVGCSRFHEKIKQLISPGVPYPVLGPRCTSDGNFNPIQCVDRECYCVNRITGTVIGTEKIDLDEKPISELSCYNPSLDLFPKSTQPFEYTTPCIASMQNKITLIEESKAAGFDVAFFTTVPQCLPDGTYGRIATRNGTKMCVDEYGKQIQNYEAMPNMPAYDNMDCKCAYTYQLLVKSETPERPVCCSNGNFRPVQCRRGQCYCVDQDGRQIARENSDVTQLSCYSDHWKTC